MPLSTTFLVAVTKARRLPFAICPARLGHWAPVATAAVAAGVGPVELGACRAGTADLPIGGARHDVAGRPLPGFPRATLAHVPPDYCWEVAVGRVVLGACTGTDEVASAGVEPC